MSEGRGGEEGGKRKAEEIAARGYGIVVGG